MTEEEFASPYGSDVFTYLVDELAVDEEAARRAVHKAAERITLLSETKDVDEVAEEICNDNQYWGA